MVKNFSVADLGNNEEVRSFVRHASKLSLGELARAMDGTEEEAATLKSVSLAGAAARRRHRRLPIEGSCDDWIGLAPPGFSRA